MSTPREVLPKVAQMVLDEWALAFPEEKPAELESFPGYEPFITATVGFTVSAGSSPMTGALRIVSRESFARFLARNLLGLDEDGEVTPEESKDALGEMANLVAGHFVTEFYGSDAIVPLCAPKIQTGTEEKEVLEVLRVGGACWECGSDGVALCVEVK